MGKYEKYYAIDGNVWPLKGLYLQQKETKTIFATVGLSLIPVPTVEMYTENRFDINRIELGIILDLTFTKKNILEIGQWISSQPIIPWDNITFLGEGHTINLTPFSTFKLIITSKLNCFT